MATMSREEIAILKQALWKVRQHEAEFLGEQATMMMLSIHSIEGNYLTFDVFTRCPDGRYRLDGSHVMKLIKS